MNAMLRIVAALAVLASALGAQTPYALVIEGQSLPGGGTVTGIRFLHLDAGAGWLVHVTTDEPSVPSMVLRKGDLYPPGPIWKQIGDPVPEGVSEAPLEREWETDWIVAVSYKVN